jgi:glycosyltransferase involved in cell wall biosynthesis
MKALFVSTFFPSNFRQPTAATFNRMRMFLDALKQRAALCLLFYCRPDVALDHVCNAAAEALVRSAWDLPDVDVILCRQQADPAHGDRLWDGYLTRATSIHRQLGYVGTSGAEQLEAFERCLDDQPDLVFAHRLNTMCPMLLTRRRLPPVFLDLDDVEHKVFLREISQPPQWFSKRLLYLQWPAFIWGERRAIKLTDKTFVCSELDARYLGRRWRLSNIAVVPNSVRMPQAQPLTTEPVLMYLGGYGYRPNAVAADYLVTRIWPIVRSACPEAKLIIAGPGPEHIACHSQYHRGVVYTGFVEDLDELYRKVRVVCSPIQSGGGTRIKIIEAAAYGKPIVSTRIGAEGLHFLDAQEILLRDEPEQFAEACLQLLRDQALCSRLGESARAKVAELYEREKVVALIKREIFG